MAQLTVISREQHSGKRWKRYSSYSFAAADGVAPLVVQELPRACVVLPTGFVAGDKGFQLVAVQGLQPGKNLWVAPNGRWLAPYVPAVYRGYPFVLANTEDGQRVLCLQDDSGLSETEGEPFFDENGKPAKTVQDVLSFLGQLAENSALTARQCALLAEHGLIQPWKIKVKGEAGEQAIQGLYCVDEVALNALAPEAFEALRKGGALPLAYAQLLSMQHLSRLGRLASHHAAAQEKLEPESGELDLEFLNQDGNISFS